MNFCSKKSSLFGVVGTSVSAVVLSVLFFGFRGSVGKESACDAGGLSLNPGLGQSPGEGNGYQL